MLKRLRKLRSKTLNGKTPNWFNEFYTAEFVPLKIRMDVLIVLGAGIFIGVILDHLT